MHLCVSLYFCNRLSSHLFISSFVNLSLSFHIYVYLCVWLPYSTHITLSIYCLLLSHSMLFCLSYAYLMRFYEKAPSKYDWFCFYFAVLCKQSRGHWLSIFECKRLPEVPSESYLVIIPIWTCMCVLVSNVDHGICLILCILEKSPITVPFEYEKTEA